MTSVEVIENVLASGVLTKALVHLPTVGADNDALKELSARLNRSLSMMHEQILKKWDGINLDVIRIYGVTSNVLGVKKIITSQSFSPAPDAIVFADDPTGFLYAEAQNGEVLSIDSSSGEVEEKARNIDDFFTRLVFGKDAAEFMGDQWLEDLRASGIA
ncbi:MULTISPECIES: SMI1/KNR4 family protein [unclassified Variovorax]|jgi:hypothetical protein|uniref:SMI1/KNR4 family protein n=1 Tax=unclassified Variovorax TaxID=663243 RepID=UPI0012F9C546|nr:SMI1/KNR4 family protein [Variovorax sp. CF313]